LDLISGSAKGKERKMNRGESPKACFRVIPEKRRDKLGVLKKAITEGGYKVKAEDIAEKILKERLFELALTAYNHKYQNCRNN
jgi:anti-sigma28 factor (negative regulator of flagellin synthesis)